MEPSSKRKSPSRGFTLVELIAIIVVLAILAGVAIPRYQEISEKAAASAIAAHMKSIKRAMLQYNYNTGTWPRDGSGAGEVPVDCPTYFNAANFNDLGHVSPIGGRYDWNYFGGSNPDICIWSIGTLSSRQSRIVNEVDRLLDDGNTSTGVFRHEPGTWGGSIRLYMESP